MDPWAEVRLRARACHAEALGASGGDRSAAAIVAATTRLRDLEVVPFAPGTRFGPGILGVYERIGLLVSIDATLPPGKRELVVAHEIAHHELHDDPVHEVTTVEASPGAAARIVGYSHRERREMEADVFAGEFLCPGDWLRGEIVGRGRRPSEIARDLGVPGYVVTKQAVRAVCLPPLKPPVPRTTHAHPLDAAQIEAATWSEGALLVDAGPGTGKTATLVGRVAHLLDTGVSPERILMLTFSTRAAGELRTRIAEILSSPGGACRPASADPAGAPWVGTIHAFGLEAVHAWHHRVGRGSRPRVLDRDGALELLERHLDDLPLAVFRDLRDPAAGLAPVLRAIERAKDEMVTPADYAAAARAAAFDGEGEAVAAAEEVAALYAAYQRLLDAADALDLGDLVMVAARLLGENDDVARHYGARFAHVLVDEMQDLNLAGVRLLQSLCGPGTTLWAVGDARQSIYRFRGAASVVGNFAEAFEGTTLALDQTYRATPEIVGAFSSFAAAMPGANGTWTATRPAGAPVRLLSAATQAGEIAALRDRIEDLRAGGTGYSDQVVLARTHRTLERVGAGLERHGVPVLYLGDLVVREEVRDLLALVSIGAEPGGLGLLRVATRTPYDVSRAAVLAVIQWAASTGATIDAALRQAATIPGVDLGSGRCLALIGRHLAAAGPNATAWTAMTEWLFETHRSADLVQAAISDARRTAVYQILRLASEEGSGRFAFLARVRRIAALNAGREHGVVPPEAQTDDAVPLMTVHAAKGLEWSAVHLPTASARHVPLPHRRDTCPPPPDLARLAMSPEDHDAEERALWFVALSRARDHLTITHARRYGGGREVKPSPYIAHVGPLAASRHDDPGIEEPPHPPDPQQPRSAYPTGDLDSYCRCPMRYRYDVVDGLAEATRPSGHRRMMRAVLSAMRHLERDAAAGVPPTYDDAASTLSATWAAVGPVGHPHERHFRSVADRLMSRLAEVVATEVGARHHHRAEWRVDVGAGVVAVRPHRVVEHPWGAVTVQIVGTRRRDQPRIAGLIVALSLGARAAFADARITIEIIDPDDGEIFDADLVDDEAVIGRYRDAIADIERGAFAPRPDPRACSACPYFFVCGA